VFYKSKDRKKMNTLSIQNKNIYKGTLNRNFGAESPSDSQKNDAILKKVVSSLVERAENEVPQTGDFINIVQEFSAKPPFIKGYLTIMPSDENIDKRVLIAAVKHKNSDYIAQSYLFEGDKEHLLNALQTIDKNSKMLNGVYSGLMEALQSHFDYIY